MLAAKNEEALRDTAAAEESTAAEPRVYSLDLRRPAATETLIRSRQNRRRARFLEEAGISHYGKPEEVADLLGYLVSPSAKWMTTCYRTNVEAYPSWQRWMQKNQRRLLVLWGKHDLSFDIGEPERYRKDVATAEIHLLDAGHFAMNTKADEVAQLVAAFLQAQH